MVDSLIVAPAGGNKCFVSPPASKPALMEREKQKAIRGLELAATTCCNFGSMRPATGRRCCCCCCCWIRLRFDPNLVLGGRKAGKQARQIASRRGERPLVAASPPLQPNQLNQPNQPPVARPLPKATERMPAGSSCLEGGPDEEVNLIEGRFLINGPAWTINLRARPWPGRAWRRATSGPGRNNSDRNGNESSQWLMVGRPRVIASSGPLEQQQVASSAGAKLVTGASDESERRKTINRSRGARPDWGQGQRHLLPSSGLASDTAPRSRAISRRSTCCSPAGPMPCRSAVVFVAAVLSNRLRFPLAALFGFFASTSGRAVGHLLRPAWR